ncbi:MAG: hypothetical protein A2176_04585 [Spirochaetes bacterium RBG_13_51_14]|nr:MAG: hypothetical protein A2176_04585 [Spirochaetes bacterium RBG_13_51_14]
MFRSRFYNESRVRIMALKNGSYNNLIDVCLKMLEDPERSGNVKEQFVWIIGNYFFEHEKSASKNMELLLNNITPPPFLNGAETLFDIKIEELKSYVRGNSTNDSLAGRIMLSQQYLKAFYPHHAPSFSKLPEDVRFELMDLIKEKNNTIISAYEKMLVDHEADAKRKTLTLIALILKNIHLKTAAPLNKLPKPAEEIIRSTFHNTDELFIASQKQMADLMDDTKIKQIVKIFFMVKQFKDIIGIAEMFKEELGRYRKRTSSARR